jgi:sigma-B regulation protein RsbU (phosphoserine phosphatase)
MFVTAIYMVLDPLRRRLVWANAGHLPPYLRRAAAPHSSVTLLEEVVSLALGILPDTRYEEDELLLEQGDAVVLYTDGVVEAKNKSRGGLGGRDLGQGDRSGRAARGRRSAIR